MGKHFDSLVDLIKDELPRASFLTQFGRDFNPNKYLSSIVNDFSLFEFPIIKKDILPLSGKDNEEYDRYLKEYLRMSQDIAGKFIVGPFEKTVIEDAESAVFLHSLGGNRFRTTISADLSKTIGEDVRMVEVADVEVFKSIPEEYGGVVNNGNNYGLFCRVYPIYLLRDSPSGRYSLIPQNKQEEGYLAQDITNATMAHIQQTIYIMDPENFIIRKENNASIKIGNKGQGKSNERVKPRKTIVRPHYVCLGEQDTRDLLSGESNGEMVIHPVAGYWKTLRSEKFKNARGKILHIEQYFRGVGKLDGRNGWHYQVYVKDKDLELRSIG